MKRLSWQRLALEEIELATIRHLKRLSRQRPSTSVLRRLGGQKCLLVMASVTDSPPVFDGAVEQYREWRRRAELWTMCTKLEEKKQGPKLVSVLSGVAWDALRHLDLSVLTSEQGVAKVMETLDSVFGDPKDVLVVEATDEAFYLTVKQPQEELVAFQTRLDAKFRCLESAGSLTIPAETKGFVLAKQAGLSTAEVREFLTLTGGSLQYDAVRSSMRRLLWDFSKPTIQRKVPVSGGKPVYVTADNETIEDEQPTLLDLLPEDEILSESEAQGVYVAYQEARNKLNATKLSRGYHATGAWPVKREEVANGYRSP